MGSIDPISASIDAGSNLAASVLGFISARNSRKSQEEINRQNIALQRETNQLNADLYREGVQNSLRMQQNEFDFNSREAQIAREWNSEGRVVQRMLAAGINPFIDPGNVSGTSSAVASGSAGSLPSPPTMVAPRNEMIAGIPDRAFQFISMLTQSIGNLALAKKQGADTKMINKTMDKLLRQMDDVHFKTWQDIQESETRAVNNRDVHDFYQAVRDHKIVQERFAAAKSKEDADIARATYNNLLEQTKKITQEIKNLVANEDLARSTIGLNNQQIEHLQTMDAQGWSQLELGLKNLSLGWYNAETQRIAATNPDGMAAMIGQLIQGFLGVDNPKEAGKMLFDKLGKPKNLLDAGVGLMTFAGEKIFGLSHRESKTISQKLKDSPLPYKTAPVPMLVRLAELYFKGELK